MQIAGRTKDIKMRACLDLYTLKPNISNKIFSVFYRAYTDPKKINIGKINYSKACV